MEIIDYHNGEFVVRDYLVRGIPTTLEVSTSEGIRRGVMEGMPVLPTQVKITLKYTLEGVMNASGSLREGKFTLTDLSLTDQGGLGNLVEYQEDLAGVFSNPQITAEIRKRQQL